MQNNGIIRNRRWVLLWLVVVIIIGLASRKYPFLFPSFLGKYPGDALWALMVYLIWGFIKPDASITTLAVLALSTSYLDEFSQIYQAPWINAIRHTFIGHVILGSWFSWIDMVSYTVGIVMGVGIELLIYKKRHTIS